MNDIVLVDSYWDCECEEGYIHPVFSCEECLLCGSKREDQPNSRDLEVKLGYDFCYCNYREENEKK